MSLSPGRDADNPLVSADGETCEDEYSSFRWSLQQDAQKSIHDLDFSVQDYIKNDDDLPETKRVRVESIEGNDDTVGTQETFGIASISASVGSEEGKHGGESKEVNEGQEWESSFLETFREVRNFASDKLR